MQVCFFCVCLCVLNRQFVFVQLLRWRLRSQIAYVVCHFACFYAKYLCVCVLFCMCTAQNAALTVARITPLSSLSLSQLVQYAQNLVVLLVFCFAKLLLACLLVVFTVLLMTTIVEHSELNRRASVCVFSAYVTCDLSAMFAHADISYDRFGAVAVVVV